MALRDLDNQKYENLSLQNITNGDELEGGQEVYLPAFFAVYWIIVIAGVIGNALTFVLFSCKRYRHFSYSVFLRALSAADSLVLIMNLCQDMDDKYFNQTFVTIKALCPFDLFFTTFDRLMCAYLLVAISFDRYVAVVHPSRSASVCTFRRSLWILGAGFTFITLLCLGISIWEIVHLIPFPDDDTYICPVIDRYRSFNVMDNVLFLGFVIILPFVIVAGLNIRVYFAIKSAVQTKTTVTLILATFLSVILNLPLAIVLALETFDNLEVRYLFDVTNLVSLFNYSMNFYVFIIHSREFRKTTKQIFRALFTKSSVPDTMTITSRPFDNPAFEDNSYTAVSSSI